MVLDTLKGTERVLITRITTRDADTFEALPHEFKDTISEVHPDMGIDSVGTYGIDLDEEWLGKVEEASNLITLTKLSDYGLGYERDFQHQKYDWQEEYTNVSHEVEHVELPDALAGDVPLEALPDKIMSATYLSRYYRVGIPLDQGQEGACFPAETQVRLANGSLKAIEDVQTLDEVLTAEGRTGKVLQTMVRHHERGLLKIHLRGHRLLKCTQEHPILTKRGYVPAEELAAGDYVAITKKPLGTTDRVRVSEYVSLGETKGTKHGVVLHSGVGNVASIVSAPPNEITLSPEFGRLAGLYLAEGATTPNKVVWTFNKNEEETLVAETVNLVRSVLGAESRLQYRPNNSINVVLYGKLWRLLFERLFGTGSGGKNLPGSLSDGPKSFLESVLYGWLDGDGYRRRNSVAGITISHQLALSMYGIATDLGLRPAIRYSLPVDNKYAKTRRPRWEVEIAVGGGTNVPQQTESAVWRKVVRKPEYEPFSGYVYNIHVEGDESYTAESVGVHNCTGFGTQNFLNAEPIMSRGTNSDAQKLYYRAREIDEYPGEDYDGSSVTAATRAAVELGKIGEWGTLDSHEACCKWILSGRGGLIYGMNWYEGMYVPNSAGYLRPTGKVVGGHCLYERGCSKYLDSRLYNSWGSDWGFHGLAWMSRADKEYMWRTGQIESICAVQIAR